MASSSRAPKQWSLTKNETINSFENWRQNLIYVLSLDANFSKFLEPNYSWGKKTKNSPRRGFEDDAATVAEAQRKTAQQKLSSLELMLGQIANYCPVISRNTLVRNSTCLSGIWQSIRLHYGFQSNGSYILDLAEYKLNPDESPEDLYQRLMAFVEDNLLEADSNISHHGEQLTDDEELTPTLENLVVLTWLRLIDPALPKLIKQRYGTELRSKTLASIKPEISVALSSLLEELRGADDAHIMRSSIRRDRNADRSSYKNPKFAGSSSGRKCSLCQNLGRPSDHYLSRCTYLSESDRQFLTRARLIDIAPQADSTDAESDPSYKACRVQVEQSPYIALFHKHVPVQITLDSGATGNMIKHAAACQLGAKINNTKQSASQADGSSRLDVIGETNFVLTRDNHSFKFDGLVVRQLDVDILGGVPFMKTNDILIRPAKSLVTVGGCLNYPYASESHDASSHSIRRTQASLLRSPTRCTIWPGEYLELPVPKELVTNDQIILEPRIDTKFNSGASSSEFWPQPAIIGCVGETIRVPNTANHPIVINKGDHLAQVQSIRLLDTAEVDGENINDTQPGKTIATNQNFHSVIMENTTIDSSMIAKFSRLHENMSSVFEPNSSGYNGTSGPIEAVVNVGSVQPPQRKGRCPQYSRDKLVELQHKFDQLSEMEFFAVLRI